MNLEYIDPFFFSPYDRALAIGKVKLSNQTPFNVSKDRKMAHPNVWTTEVNDSMG